MKMKHLRIKLATENENYYVFFSPFIETIDIKSTFDVIKLYAKKFWLLVVYYCCRNQFSLKKTNIISHHPPNPKNRKF